MPFFVKRNGQAVPIVSDPNVINDTTASQNTAYSGSKVDSLIANKIDALTPKVYSLFIAKTDWDETGTVEIDVPGTFGYNIPSENYNQLVLSDEQTDHWRRFNVCLDHAHDASGYITTIEFSCDPGNIPDRPIYFNIVSSKSEYVDWSVIGNLIVPPGLQVDTSFDSDSTNPVQNKVVKAALDGKATPADIAALINDTTASQNTAYSGSKVDSLIANHTHASSQINAMTGYSKPSSTSSISPADSLNTAIGKVEKGLEGKQSPLSLGQYSGLGREIQVMDNEEVGQTWYNTGVVDIEPSSSEGKLTVSKVDDSTFPGSVPYTSEDIDIPGWEKVENSPITTTATGTDLTLSTSSGNLNALTVYGKSEVVDGAIKSAGDSGSIEIETCQKNLLDPTKYYQRSGYTNLTVNCTNNVIQIGNVTSGGRFIAWNIKTTPGERVTISWTNTNNVSGIGIKTTEKFVDEWAGYGPSIASGAIITASTEWLQVWSELQTTEQGTASITKLQVEKGSTATAYEPYNGTMSTFTTGTPLRGIPDSNVRDVMVWDGTSGEATKNCGKVRLADLTWELSARYSRFYAPINPSSMYHVIGADENPQAICNKYTPNTTNNVYNGTDKTIGFGAPNTYLNNILVCDKDYTTVSDFVASLGDAELVYELATPTTEQLTSTENASIAALRTFTPQTHAQNNAGAEMTVEAYAGTANGKAVANLKTELQITQSDTLTLTTAGWSNNAQTVSYAHDTAKRNVIDVDPASVEEWASWGVLATAETTSGITFTCKTVPENALTFRVTSMGV